MSKQEIRCACGGDLSYSDQFMAWQCDACQSLWKEVYDECGCVPYVMDGVLVDDCVLCGGTGFCDRRLVELIET